MDQQGLSPPPRRSVSGEDGDEKDGEMGEELARQNLPADDRVGQQQGQRAAFDFARHGVEGHEQGHERHEVDRQRGDNRSAPSAPVGAEPAADSTSEKTTISSTVISTQRLRRAILDSIRAVAIVRTIIGRPSN